MSEKSGIGAILAETATISLRNVRFSPILTIDELILEGGDLEFTPAALGADPRFSSGETRFRGVMTESNVNSLLAGVLPADAPVRNLKLTLLTGRAQIKGHFVKSVMSLPFTLDAKPLLTNGIRLSLDCSATQIGGIGLPGAAVDIIERVLNEKLFLDLTDSPFPVRLDEVRCEPGRVTVIGRARLSWPLGEPNVETSGPPASAIPSASS